MTTQTNQQEDDHRGISFVREDQLDRLESVFKHPLWLHDLRINDARYRKAFLAYLLAGTWVDPTDANIFETFKAEYRPRARSFVVEDTEHFIMVNDEWPVVSSRRARKSAFRTRGGRDLRKPKLVAAIATQREVFIFEHPLSDAA